jgi:1,4-alpha-glucan branching enzyme
MLKKRFFKTKPECEVSFELEFALAGRVELVCESNGWEPIAMKRAGKDRFRARVRLPGERRYQFRYLVDGTTWINDETADAYQRNEFGGENSVLSTTRGDGPSARQ